MDPANTADTAAALRYQDFILGIMGNPLFLGQQYPADVLNTPGVDLTALKDDQIASIHGRVNFWAFDPYVARFASAAPEGVQVCASNSSNPLWPYCATLSNVQANAWAMGEASIAYSYIAPQYVC